VLVISIKKYFDKLAVAFIFSVGHKHKDMDEHEKKDKHKSLYDRFVRWQQLTISQLSFTNNLFLGLNLGFLSFFITQSGFSISCICCLLTLQVLTFLGLGISFITGIMAVWNRLIDFRTTTQLVKKRKQKFEHEHNIKIHSDIESIKSSISVDKTLTDKLGEKTWQLLKWQIWTFLIGTLIGTIYLIIDKNACG
jgi:hypothetical protein